MQIPSRRKDLPELVNAALERIGSDRRVDPNSDMWIGVAVALIALAEKIEELQQENDDADEQA